MNRPAISPQTLRCGLVVIDPGSGAVQRVVSLQYNPDTVSRTLQVQGAGESGERSEVARLKGPAVETIKLDAEIDATDQLETPDQHAAVVQFGIQPQLALLEGLINPSAASLRAADSLASRGTLEIVPVQAPLTLFVWSRQRVLAVRITELSVTEEAFDPDLNPLRAKVSLGMRVLSVNDVAATHKAGLVFMAHLQNQEKLAGEAPSGQLSALGLGGIP